MAGYLWPFPKGAPVSQRFGTNPGGFNPAGGHTGTDFAVPSGTPVHAAADGVIDAAQYFALANGSDNPWLLTPYGGLTVILNAGAGKPAFIYAHLSRALVKPGQRVTRGQIIAYSGSSGSASTGPHCHMEALPDGWDLTTNTYGRVDPALYCSDYYTPTTTTGITMATPNEVSQAVWDTKIQQFNEDRSKGSIQTARFLFGNMSQWIVQLRTRADKIIANQAEIRKELAEIKELLKK